MIYNFEESYDESIAERICRINDVDPRELCIDDFTPDMNMDLLVKFREKILSLKDARFFIVGDYDCDGICGLAIIKKLLDDLGIRNNYYIPSRSKEGYGLNMNIVKTAIDNGFDVLLTIDNGIVANDELRYAKENGLTTLVIDHHEYLDEPDCDMYLHPDLFAEEYHDMCAGGLACLLSISFRDDSLSKVYGGLATLADMVSVLRYNRYLLKEMMRILDSEDIHTIRLLLGNNELSYDSLSFNVIPKINAVSRLDAYGNVNHVVRYLLSDRQKCLPYLKNIETINRKRQELTRKNYELALNMIDDSAKVIVVRSPEFIEGICGLIANKLMNAYHKPAIVLSEADGKLKGSGRSPNGCNLYEYLYGTKDLFETFGGHAQALGLSLDEKNYDGLISFIEENELMYQEVAKDVVLLRDEDLDFRTYEDIEGLRPFGTGFPEPLIGVAHCAGMKKMVMAKKYPKFFLNNICSAISFNTAYLDKEFDTMIGHLKKDNYYRDKLSLFIEELI